MCWIVSDDDSLAPLSPATIRPLCLLMAAMMGATFMKFGRAPTIVSIFIWRSWDLWPFLAADLLVCVHDPDDRIHHGLQGCVIPTPGSDCAVSANQFDFCSDVFDILNQNQTALFGQVTIHRADLAAEYAIDGNAERGRFTIHRAATTNHKIGIPDNIQSIDYPFRDEYSSLRNKLGPEVSYL